MKSIKSTLFIYISCIILLALLATTTAATPSTPSPPANNQNNAHQNTHNNDGHNHHYTKDYHVDEWRDLYLTLLSYNRLEAYNDYGPWGELKDDEKERDVVDRELEGMSMIEERANHPSDEHPSLNAENQPKYINLHNFLITEDDIKNNMWFQTQHKKQPRHPAWDMLKDVQPYYNIEQFDNNVVIKNVQSNIPSMSTIREALKKLIAAGPSTPISHEKTNLFDMDLEENQKRAIAEQAHAYNQIIKLFPPTPYVRLEIENKGKIGIDDSYNPQIHDVRRQHSLSQLKKFKNFIEEFAENILGAKYNYMRTTEYERHWKNPPGAVLIIEPDRVLHHGNHYERSSESGSRALILVIIIFSIILGSQLLFQWWSQHPVYQNSYNLFIVITLWCVPFCVAMIDSFRRFIIIWSVYTILTALTISLLFVDLNPALNAFLSMLDSLGDSLPQSDDGSDPSLTGSMERRNAADYRVKNYYIIPQRYIFAIVYKYFLFIHKLIMVLLGLSIAVFVLDILGAFQYIGLEPRFVGELYHGHTATPDEVLSFMLAAFYGVFYAIYFGVLNRDIATVVIPHLTGWATHFKVKKFVEAKPKDEVEVAKTAPVDDHIQPFSADVLSSDDHAHDQQWPDWGPNDDAENTECETEQLMSQRNQPRVVPDNNHSITNSILTSRGFESAVVNKTNSCGICHELLRSQTDSTTAVLTTSGGRTDQDGLTMSDKLPTLAEIRNRLSHSNTPKTHWLTTCTTKMLTTTTLIIFYIIELIDSLTGGSGQVTLEHVTVVEGTYKIQAANDLHVDHHNAADLEDDDDEIGMLGDLSHSAFAGRAQQDNQIQTNHDVVFKLPCNCAVHDLCLRGYMLLGKDNVCPSCKEISAVGKIFSSPWNSSYDNYKNFLEAAKYCIAVNPLLLFIINIILNVFW